MDRPIPSSPEAEQGALCSIFLAPVKSLDLCEEMITPEMIYNPANRVIFEAIARLHAKKEAIDLLTVTAALQQARMLESVGGAYYLSQLQSIIPTAANLKFYLEIIRSSYHKRQILQACSVMEEATYGGDDDVAEKLPIVEQAIEGWKNGVLSCADTSRMIWHEALEDLEAKNDLRRENGGLNAVLGIATGLRKVDRMDGGLKPNTFTIIAARPSQGKTRLLTQYFLRAAFANQESLFFSMEMPASDVIQSILCQNEAITVDGMEGYLKETDFPKISATIAQCKQFIHIDDSPYLTLAEIKMRARRHMLKHPNTKIIAIDHHCRIKGTRSKNSSQEEMLAEIAVGLSVLRKELKVHLILLCQINRAGADRPRMEHIKGSGAFEQEADNIWLIHMDENTEAMVRKGHLHKDKGRNTPIGSVEVEFHKDHLLFKEK